MALKFNFLNPAARFGAISEPAPLGLTLANTNEPGLDQSFTG